MNTILRALLASGVALAALVAQDRRVFLHLAGDHHHIAESIPVEIGQRGHVRAQLAEVVRQIMLDEL